MVMLRPRAHGASSDAAGTAGAQGAAGFSARRDATAQTFTAGAWVAGTFDVEEEDDDGAFSAATGEYTAPRDGWYGFAGQLTAGTTLDGLDATELARVSLFVNGNQKRDGGNAYSTDANRAGAEMTATFIKLAAGDVVTLRLRHTHATDLPQLLGTGLNWFSGVRLG